MDDSALAGLLEQFGFSKKEIDTYLVLLEHGEATASTVADDAGVSKRYVYSISENLESRGFVTVNDHVVPTTIRANPPEEVIETLSGEVERMRPALEDRYTTAPQSADEFEVVKSRVTVRKRIAALIDEASEEVILSVPYSQLSEVESSLRDAVERGLLVLLVVTSVDPGATGLDEELAGLGSVVRVWYEAMPTMVTADRTRSVIAPQAMVTRSNSGEQAITFTQEQLAPVMVGSFFGNYWPNAEQVAVAPRRPLPDTYRDFRQAVLQATLHLREETPIVATVRGRALDADDPSDRTEEPAATELRGRLVEVRQGMVVPVNNTFPVESSLVVETETGRYTVGGRGAFVEDVEADEVTLEVADPGDDSSVDVADTEPPGGH
ncbi:TrmB family transcriptional regulator [Halomarina oriensis]|uniref:TrmB family transcriptional regulator n=1 Tax=Halomarina oriensis TaxID=671145 RepID=A0A6B0GQD4_9EURY|nr:TrmB family transcriptional regulator [Halomarina oriensis]MWG36281.1 TrmB family transcriptional regulator [Halomarina oriensis]